MDKINQKIQLQIPSPKKDIKEKEDSTAKIDIKDKFVPAKGSSPYSDYTCRLAKRALKEMRAAGEKGEGPGYSEERDVGDKFLTEIMKKGTRSEVEVAHYAKKAAAQYLYNRSAEWAQTFALYELAAGIKGPISAVLGVIGSSAIAQARHNDYEDSALLGKVFLEGISKNATTPQEKILADTVIQASNKRIKPKSVYNIQDIALYTSRAEVKDTGKFWYTRTQGDDRGIGKSDIDYPARIDEPIGMLLSDIGVRAMRNVSNDNDNDDRDGRLTGAALLKGILENSERDEEKILADVAIKASGALIGDESGARVQREAMDMMMDGITGTVDKTLAIFGHRTYIAAADYKDARKMGNKVLQGITANAKDEKTRTIAENSLQKSIDSSLEPKDAVIIQQKAFNEIKNSYLAEIRDNSDSPSKRALADVAIKISDLQLEYGNAKFFAQEYALDSPDSKEPLEGALINFGRYIFSKGSTNEDRRKMNKLVLRSIINNTTSKENKVIAQDSLERSNKCADDCGADRDAVTIQLKAFTEIEKSFQ